MDRPLLVIMLMGGTGVGKSTLLNALAGGAIAQASFTRPTTRDPVVYYHHSVPPTKLDDYKGKVKIISTIPSVNTPVCDAETRRFNEEAAKLPPNVVVLTVSMDLPFAQARWCGAAGVDKVTTLSDYRGAHFGETYGVLIKELYLHARVVFVVDKNDKIVHVEYVKEVADHPNYESALTVAKSLAGDSASA